MRYRLKKAWGRTNNLSDISMHRLAELGFDLDGDLHSYMIHSATDGEIRDAIEAWFLAVEGRLQADAPAVALSAMEICAMACEGRVNEILDAANVSYRLEGTLTVDRASIELHATTVEPSLSLLAGHPELRRVEAAYQKALVELRPGGDAGDAITDAAAALQEMLLALGAGGNALGPLLKSARTRGLLGPYDSKLGAGVELIGEWVSADRSGRGDAHAPSGAVDDDAWLAVHVVGALIVRLAARLTSAETDP
jgi:hypothetical protein